MNNSFVNLEENVTWVILNFGSPFSASHSCKLLFRDNFFTLLLC